MWCTALIFAQGVVVSRACTVDTGQLKRQSFGQYAQYVWARSCSSTSGSLDGMRASLTQGAPRRTRAASPTARTTTTRRPPRHPGAPWCGVSRGC